MKTIISSCCALLILLSPAYAAIPVIDWDIDTTSARPIAREIIRGESLYLRPRYLDGRTPMDLTDVYSVVLRYRPDTMAEGSYYIATGTVHNASAGIVQIAWTPGMETPENVVRYHIVASSAAGGNLRGFGTIRFIGSIQGDPEAMTPTVSATYDWAQITEHINPEAAPFAGPADLLGINQRLDGHDQDIIDLTDLVGDGVQGVQDQLATHISTQAVVDAEQDILIQLALDSATTTFAGIGTTGVVTSTTNDTGKFLRANGTWEIPDVTSVEWDVIENKPETFPPAAHVHDISEVTGLQNALDGKSPTNHVHTIPDVTGLQDAINATIQQSGTATAWTHGGGTYTQETIVATSPLIDTGLASVSVEFAPMAGMMALWEMSSTGSTWIPFAQSASPRYVRLRLVEEIPTPGALSTTVSNIIVTTWTRPDLFGQSNDTAGQALLADTATAPRQVVPLAQMQSAVGAVTPAAWSEYPATQNVRLDGNKMILGGGWTIFQQEGYGYLSSVDVWGTTNGLTIANNGTPVITAMPGLAGLHISSFSLVDGVATVGISTNGVGSQPRLQWTASLSAIDWANLTPDSETWPDTTNGVYQIVATLPEGNMGFVRAVRDTGAGSITMHAHTEVTGTITAESFTLTGNRLAIPTAITIPTNATYTISYTNGAFTAYDFGAGTADLTITLEGPGAGFRSQHEVYWASGYTNRAVTWTNTAGALTWINDEPTTDEAQVMFIWTGTNAAAINTTVTQ